MATSTNNLRKLLEYRFKNERLEMFDGQGQLVLIVTQFMIKMRHEDDELIALLKSLDDLARSCSGSSRHSEEYRNFSKEFRSFMVELKVFFGVPNSMRTLIHPNELVAIFIDLFLEILEEIIRLQPNFILRLKVPIQKLTMELKFLITFLGDTPSQPTELYSTKNLLSDIEATINDVGSFLYSFFFITDRILVTEMNQKLSYLLENLELVTEKMMEHCITVTKILPSCRTPKTDVVSLFLVDSILDDLENVIMNHKDDRITSVEALIRTIHRQLMFLRSLLACTEVEQYSGLEEFVIRFRDVVYEVEYVVSSFSPVWYLTIRLLQVIEKTKLIRIQIQGMEKKYDARMLKVADYPMQQISLHTQTLDIGDEVGLEDETKKIKDQLLGDIEQLQFISIFGMPGLGKTTLAKKVYHDPAIIQHFHKRAWCVVSQNYQIRNILIDILTSMDVLNKEAMMDMDEDSLGEKLYQSLIRRRYFIVMDDIWNVDPWNKIKAYIPNGGEGSRILFTTRNKDVASEASSSSSSNTNALRRLTDKECWKLLQRKVFRQNSCPENLIITGEEIARKCDGLPLAVVVIAAVLANMEREQKLWEDVAERISSHIAKESNKFMNILELSYNSLPMHLKPCFLYFGAFEEDREIAVRKLISLWIAEGFIEKVENMEAVAQDYLKHLIGRSLVQVAKRRSDGGIKTCRIHDLLRDMCLQIAEKDKFMKVIPNQLMVYEQCQRLSIHSRSIPSFSRPFGLHVRTLLGHLPDPSKSIFGNLKLLKVLDLSSVDFRFYSSTRVEDLVLLRFLTVSSMPSSIERFENLEFLFVDNRKTVEIPENIFNMVKLRHVYFSGGAKFSRSWRERAAANDLRFHESSLQRFSYVSIYDKEDERILRFSPNLRRLKCRFAAFLDSSQNYRYPVLEFLDQLESLSISFRRNYVTDYRSPDLTDLPLKLRRLTLRSFNFSRKQMEIIGKQLDLEVLKLRDGTIVGKSWDTSEGEFENLKFLELDEVQIKHWNVLSNQFPKLERLVLRSCKLLKIPSDLEYCPSLRKIEVHGCKKSVHRSARKIKKLQKDYNNEVEVNISPSVARRL